MSETDVAIVGSGIAGAFLALKLQRPCVLIASGRLGADSASLWAQGGLAAALAPDDSAEAHAADTIAAGAGLVDPVVAHVVAAEGPACVRDLAAIGAPFDRDAEGRLALSLEAAHSRARVVRVGGDHAGRDIMAALIAAARARPHIHVLEGTTALGLLQDDHGRVCGMQVQTPTGALDEVRASEVVLATGGVGGLYAVTTNPVASVGRGLAMAARAGALIADPEFVQFHPTAMDVGRDPAPLASESLRGEGATLVDAAGKPFMATYHPAADLAPRDVVARAIHAERAAGRGAYLDARALRHRLPEHFTSLFAACQAAGLDPREQPIPVAPAAHYHMGGIVTDLWARATLEGLSAIGECASTGLHGANRLASNSLVEGLVFAARAAQRLNDAELTARAGAAPPPPPRLPALALGELRALMSAHLGVLRTREDRAAALKGIDRLVAQHGLSDELLCAQLIATGAAGRLESRGAHHCPDHPTLLSQARRTFLTLHDLQRTP